ncbi:MAG: Lrp/AsnC family transcriptional regulator [Candidatus Geothermarchaeales archaeon]
MSQELDRIDREIIKALREDARTPFTKIGRTLGVSDATVHVRVNRMRRAGIIKKYTTIVDERAVGRGVAGYVLISVKHGRVEEVSKELARMEMVTMIQEIHGANDILIKIETGDPESLRNAVMKTQELTSVTASECFIIFKTWKE